MENSEEQNWYVECSDDELKDIPDPWEPEPEQIDRIYSLLAKGQLPEIKWKCPGYRTPSPEIKEEPKPESEAVK